MREIQAPDPIIIRNSAVFLAGSIEMGEAERWQDIVILSLADTDCTVLNPRRDDWDSSWEQSISNKKFKEQVLWELAAMAQADVIAMYFDPTTKAPISLLELGLYAYSRKLIVCCPEGYWRKGNVDIVCERCCVNTAKTLDELIKKIRSQV